jgi:signal transduction protein with GAF and PtsI domain
MLVSVEGMDTLAPIENAEVDLLHEIGSRFATSDELYLVLERVLDFVLAFVKCDSCFIYVLEQDELVLRASKNPHPEVMGRLKLRVGQGITGWVAQHRQPVAIKNNAAQDPRFQFFNDLPEDSFEAFLSVPVLCRRKLVGVINVQHRKPHEYSLRAVRLIATIGFLVAGEIEMARLECENFQLADQLETRKLMERAKGILQRDLSLTEEEAYIALQRQSRQRRLPMKQLAEAIILSAEVKGQYQVGLSPK